MECAETLETATDFILHTTSLLILEILEILKSTFHNSSLRVIDLWFVSED